MNVEQLNFPKASELDKEFRHQKLMKALKNIKESLLGYKEDSSIGMKFEIKSGMNDEYGGIPEDLLNDIISFLQKYEYKCEIRNERVLFTNVKYLRVYYK